MTLTSHKYHIPGTPADEPVNPILNCGGPGVCEVCTFDMRWVQDCNAKRALLFPKEDDGLDSQLLRKISAKIRSQNTIPNKMTMLNREYILSRTIFALANAIDGVANDKNGL